MACLHCCKHWSTPCPMCDGGDEFMADCSVCNRKDVSEHEHDRVADQLNQLDIEEFEMVIEAMGISDCWESSVICQDCFNYYAK